MFEADYSVMAIREGRLQKLLHLWEKDLGDSLYSDNSKPFSYQYQDKIIPNVIFFGQKAITTRILHPDRVRFVSEYKEMLMTALRSLLFAAPEARPIFICLCGLRKISSNAGISRWQWRNLGMRMGTCTSWKEILERSGRWANNDWWSNSYRQWEYPLSKSLSYLEFNFSGLSLIGNT